MTFGVLFDLDGTLVDTAPDLVAVLNTLLREEGFAPMPYAVARNEVSNGALGLIRLGFGSDLGAERSAALRARFLAIYARYLCINSRLFIEIDYLYNLTSRGFTWGIVTNKPAAFTVPLVERLGIASLTACIVSGDSLPQRKPDPAPLLLGADRLDVDPRRCVYVGDARRDIEAGRAAGMRTIAALWGYIRATDDPTQWAADAAVAHPRELPGILDEMHLTGA